MPYAPFAGVAGCHKDPFAGAAGCHKDPFAGAAGCHTAPPDKFARRRPDAPRAVRSTRGQKFRYTYGSFGASMRDHEDTCSTGIVALRG